MNTAENWLGIGKILKSKLYQLNLDVINNDIYGAKSRKNTKYVTELSDIIEKVLQDLILKINSQTTNSDLQKYLKRQYDVVF